MQFSKNHKISKIQFPSTSAVRFYLILKLLNIADAIKLYLCISAIILFTLYINKIRFCWLQVNLMPKFYLFVYKCSLSFYSSFQ